MSGGTPVRRIGVVGNLHYPELEAVLDDVRAAADEHGVETLYEEALGGGGARGGKLEEGWDGVQLLVTLGGDGTLLRGARIAGPRRVPVLGCNLGRLGFLTGMARDEIREGMGRLAAGEFEVEERLTLRVAVHAERPAASRVDEAAGEGYYTVNDAVIHKSGFARLITLRVWADDEEVGQYSADGIILATATGSTAYSLSAGGPIVVPTMDGIVATPISPHTLAVRSVVLPGSTRLSVELFSDHGDVVLTVDGQVGCQLRAGDRVEAVRSADPMRLVRLPGYRFFSVLRRKLHWGDVRPADR